MVLVVGMHRSGTSALTGLLAALGLGLPPEGDRLSGQPDNPEHHESRTLVDLNEGLLRRLGGRWGAPPPPEVLAHQVDTLADRVPAAARTLAQVFGTGPAVWKDPRLCLLLPFWRAVLVDPPPVLLVLRPPLAVARSLTRRDGYPLSLGLGLWLAYHRQALAGLGGLDVAVVHYEAALADPRGTAATLAGWLGSRGVDPADPAAAAGQLRSDLRHQAPDGDELPDEVAAAARILARLEGEHRSFVPPDLPEPAPWVQDLFEVERRLESEHDAYEENQAALVAELARVTELLHTAAAAEAGLRRGLADPGGPPRPAPG